MNVITTEAPAGLLLKVYPPNWSGETLDLLHAWGLKVYDAAPSLGAWLCDTVTAEQLRRLRENSDEPVEVTPVTLPFTRWTNSELVAALNAVTAVSYTTNDPHIGTFFDRLVGALNAAVGARLTSEGTR